MKNFKQDFKVLEVKNIYLIVKIFDKPKCNNMFIWLCGLIYRYIDSV